MDPCLDRYLLILKFIWWQGALILDCHWWITFIGPEDLDKHSTFWLRFPSGWLASMLPPPSFLTRLMRAQPRLDCGVYGSSRKNIPDTKISKGQRFPFSTINSFSGVINSFLGSLAGVPGTSMVQGKVHHGTVQELSWNILSSTGPDLHKLRLVACDWSRNILYLRCCHDRFSWKRHLYDSVLLSNTWLLHMRVGCRAVQTRLSWITPRWEAICTGLLTTILRRQV